MIVKTGRKLIADYLFGKADDSINKESLVFTAYLSGDPKPSSPFVTANDEFGIFTNADKIACEATITPSLDDLSKTGVFQYEGDKVYKYALTTIASSGSATALPEYKNQIELNIDGVSKPVPVEIVYVNNAQFTLNGSLTNDIDALLTDVQKETYVVLQAFDGNELHLILRDQNGSTTDYTFKPKNLGLSKGDTLSKDTYIAKYSKINGVLYTNNVTLSSALSIKDEDSYLSVGSTSVDFGYTPTSDDAASIFQKGDITALANLSNPSSGASDLRMYFNDLALIPGHLYSINNGTISLATNKAFITLDENMVATIYIQASGYDNRTFRVTNVLLTYKKVNDMSETSNETLFSRELIQPFTVRKGHNVFSKLEIQL